METKKILDKWEHDANVMLQKDGFPTQQKKILKLIAAHRKLVAGLEFYEHPMRWVEDNTDSRVMTRGEIPRGMRACQTLEEVEKELNGIEDGSQDPTKD